MLVQIIQFTVSTCLIQKWNTSSASEGQFSGRGAQIDRICHKYWWLMKQFTLHGCSWTSYCECKPLGHCSDSAGSIKTDPMWSDCMGRHVMTDDVGVENYITWALFSRHWTAGNWSQSSKPLANACAQVQWWWFSISKTTATINFSIVSIHTALFEQLVLFTHLLKILKTPVKVCMMSMMAKMLLTRKMMKTMLQSLISNLRQIAVMWNLLIWQFRMLTGTTFSRVNDMHCNQVWCRL